MNPHLIPALPISRDALTAERTRLDIVAVNLANSQTTRDANGQVFHRKQVIFESFMPQEGSSDARLPHVRVAKIADDSRALPQVHRPGHPHADKDGMVTMPNVNVIEEMVDMMTATRSYEANMQAAQSARQMFSNALRITGA